jgi:hypothetical protein
VIYVKLPAKRVTLLTVKPPTFVLENLFTPKNHHMKKFTVYIVTAMLVLTSVSTPLKAANETVPASTTATSPAASAEANALLNRLDEINAMDKASLSRTEKKLLRKEVRSIKSELKTLNGGVYVSVGAIIIILLLLIILL